MIHCEVNIAEDDVQFAFWARCLPAVGDTLWYPPGGRLTGSYQVDEVCHWISPEWSPITYAGDPPHHAALYVHRIE